MSSDSSRRFNADRFELARLRRGITKRSLSQSLGVTSMAVGRYSKGEREPASDVVEKIADILSFPVEFFYGETLTEASQKGPSFRALSKLTARQRDQAVAAGTLGMYLSDWVERKFRLPRPNIPQYENAVIPPESASMELRVRWGLGERPIKNMVHLLEYHGIRVFALAEETRSVDAYSFWHDSKPFMFLNTSKSAERSRMDAAHELGHLAIHSSEIAQRSPHLEREAQEFAASFLMPRRSVLARIQPGAMLPEIIEAKHYWNVSAANLTHRIHRLGLLTKYQYTSTFIEIGKRNFRTEEPEPSERETSQVLNKVFGRLREKGTTVAQVADELSLHPEEVSKLLLGLVSFPLPMNYHTHRTRPSDGARQTTATSEKIRLLHTEAGISQSENDCASPQ